MSAGHIEFTKMEGLGNDYVFVDTLRYPIDNPSELAVRISDRHRGIGSDGLILIGGSDKADFSMRIINADGSEAQMCGNGARCVGRYVYDKGLTSRTRISLETLSGIKAVEIHPDTGLVSVGMGAYLCDRSVWKLTALGRSFEGYYINVGNPHFVVFTSDGYLLDRIGEYGPVLEHDSSFPEGCNIEFAEPTSPSTIRMRVWERGSGITMACGTGACATAAAAAEAGLVKDSCTVSMDGGDLHISISPDRILTMTGPAVFVFDGRFEST